MLKLEDSTAHLWLLWSDEVKDARLLEACQALMSADEAAQHRRFVLESSRHQYLLTRALVRTTLSRYAPIAPKEWTFVRNPHGRPDVAGPSTAPPLYFNLSNTSGLIACVVATQAEVGVDVEDMARETETVSIANRFFSPEEAKALRRTPPERQRERFFTYWTLKEAYIKARGMGLAIPLEQFTFTVDPDRISIAFDARLADTPHTWQFNLFHPSERHMMATAIRLPSGRPVHIETRVTVPLLD